jgi:hypothetical protein
MAPNSRTNLSYSLPPGCRKLAVISDVHIGIHDDPALRALVECFEDQGVDSVVANGDIHDCAAISRHPGKAALARLESGQLAEEIAGGRWFVDWLNTRFCLYGEGNHEQWINDVALAVGAVGTITVGRTLGLPESESFVVLPSGYQVRIGSLVLEHGDKLFPRSSGAGPANLARTILQRFPGQTTGVGHYHRMDAAWATHIDAAGVPRSHAAFGLGHVSLVDKHIGYAGRAPNWQQGAAIIDLWQDGAKPRFTVHMIEVHRDRRNRPLVEFNGHVYR